MCTKLLSQLRFIAHIGDSYTEYDKNSYLHPKSLVSRMYFIGSTCMRAIESYLPAFKCQNEAGLTSAMLDGVSCGACSLAHLSRAQ